VYIKGVSISLSLNFFSLRATFTIVEYSLHKCFYETYSLTTMTKPLLLSAIALASFGAAAAFPELIPGLGLPSLAELGLTSEQLYNNGIFLAQFVFNLLTKYLHHSRNALHYRSKWRATRHEVYQLYH
jgi:hypothetical protein